MFVSPDGHRLDSAAQLLTIRDDKVLPLERKSNTQLESKGIALSLLLQRKEIMPLVRWHLIQDMPSWSPKRT